MNSLVSFPFDRIAPAAVVLTAGALVLTESLLAPSPALDRGAFRYSLAHYVASPCGRFAVPLLWAHTFAHSLTAMTPQSHPDVWRRIAADLARAAVRLRRCRFTFSRAVAITRAAVRESATLDDCGQRGITIVPAHDAQPPTSLAATALIRPFPAPLRHAA